MRYETGTLELTLGSQKFETTYEKKVYEKFEDLLLEAQAGEKETANILKKLNYAEDLDRRTSTRAEFVKDGDAAKAASIEAQIKAFMKAREKANKPITESEARKKVLALMEE